MKYEYKKNEKRDVLKQLLAINETPQENYSVGSRSNYGMGSMSDAASTISYATFAKSNSTPRAKQAPTFVPRLKLQ